MKRRLSGIKHILYSKARKNGEIITINQKTIENMKSLLYVVMRVKLLTTITIIVIEKEAGRSLYG